MDNHTNNYDLPIDLTREFIKARNLLHNISQVSWSYSVLNKKHPIDSLSIEGAEQLISAYKDLIDDARQLLIPRENTPQEED